MPKPDFDSEAGDTWIRSVRAQRAGNSKHQRHRPAANTAEADTASFVERRLSRSVFGVNAPRLAVATQCDQPAHGKIIKQVWPNGSTERTDYALCAHCGGIHSWVVSWKILSSNS